MDKEKDSYVETALKLISKLKPHWKITRDISAGGSGFVGESLFTFDKDHSFWLVWLCNGNFAFKKVTPEWIKLYSNLVLSSSRVVVAYDMNHKIVEWSVEQEKQCPTFGQDKKDNAEKERNKLSPV